MTETTTAVDTAAVPKKNDPADAGVDAELVGRLVEQARAAGLQLTGDGGLLQQLTKRVLEAALDGEITDHLGYDKGDPAGKNGQNSRNGSRAKTVLTEVGPVEVAVPRDRGGSFEPRIVKKRQRRLTGVEDMVISLSAKGLTTGEIQAHLAEVYGADVSRQTISTITDKVLDAMGEWQNRPLDPIYPVIFLDAVHVKIRDGKVANRPIYVALAVTVDGTRDILGLWAGDGGEGAKFWLQVLTELKNRGVDDACMVVCDGLKGLPDAIGQTWPLAVVQTCVIHRTRKRTSCCLAVRSSLIWYGRYRGDARSARGEMRGVAAASERAATTSDAGDGGAVARERRGACGGPDRGGQRDHGPQGRRRVGGRRAAPHRRPGAQARRWAQIRR
jgi:putative transposase